MMNLLAQTDTAIDLRSIGGIVVVTTLIVEWLAVRFKDNSGFGKIPVIAWRVVVACLLCLGANKIGWLPGNWKELIAQAVTAILGAAGLRQVLINPTKTIGEAQPILGAPPIKPDAIKAEVAAVNAHIEEAHDAAAANVAQAVTDAANLPPKNPGLSDSIGGSVRT